MALRWLHQLREKAPTRSRLRRLLPDAEDDVEATSSRLLYKVWDTESERPGKVSSKLRPFFPLTLLGVAARGLIDNDSFSCSSLFFLSFAFGEGRPLAAFSGSLNLELEAGDSLSSFTFFPGVSLSLLLLPTFSLRWRSLCLLW